MANTAHPPRQLWIMAGTLGFALLCLINPPFIGTAPLQTGPTIVTLAALYFVSRKWPLPTASIACICGFLVLHTIGARYIYSYVPYDGWFVMFGLPEPTAFFGWERNHYDRLVHFTFGLLLVHPIAAFLTGHWKVSHGRALYIAAECIIAASALYEVFEWLLTLVLASADAEAYNGQQGDFWDAQKDMALASLGAVIAACTLYGRKRRADQLGQPKT